MTKTISEFFRTDQFSRAYTIRVYNFECLTTSMFGVSLICVENRIKKKDQQKEKRSQQRVSGRESDVKRRNKSSIHFDDSNLVWRSVYIIMAASRGKRKCYIFSDAQKFTVSPKNQALLRCLKLDEIYHMRLHTSTIVVFCTFK